MAGATSAPDDVPAGYRPGDLQAAYALPSTSRGNGETVAIVDAYDSPSAEADLAAYRAQFGPPPCTSESGCFRKVNQSGAAGPLPPADPGWGLEISLDLDMVSAMYPAASRYVTAVGGTSLVRADGARGWSETACSGAGSGCSAYIAKPSWQHDPNCPTRMVADVSAVADPNTGVAVYDTFGYGGWQLVGGTSVSAPIIAATYALNGQRSTFDPANLYRVAQPSQFNDVVGGTNVPGQFASTCGGEYLCTGLPGYDGPTGRGTPRTPAAF